MPSAQYPFYRFKFGNGVMTPPTRLYLPVRLRNPGTGLTLVTYGLVDTGADSTLLPGSLALQLGHDLRSRGAKSSVSMGIENTQVTTWRHTFDLELLSSDGTQVVRSFDGMEIDCSETEPPPLLGASDFLGYFDWSIKYNAGAIVLRW
jgi:predicted aspartyl protease